MNRTPQQVAAISAVIESVRAGGGKHFCLRSRAGTGKTSSVLELVDDYAEAFPDHQVVVCAFGKAPSVEVQEKLKKRGHTDWQKVRASTIHSLGLSTFNWQLKPRIEQHKIRLLIDQQNEAIYREHGVNIARLVSFAKLEGFGFFADAQIGDVGAWYRVADHYDINGFDDTSAMDDVVAAAQHIYKLSLAQTNIVDFDDMILFPLVKNIRVRYQPDLLVVDEAQDTGRARQALIRKFVKPTGCLLVVGDDRQGIFGFAGAQADALDRLITDLEMEVLPLTVCWRCPKSVLRLAQELVPDIEWPETAIEGEVLRVTELPELRKTDAILCRNTAPLIETAYGLLRQGVACRVEGREIGTGLLRLVNRWQVTTIAAFLTKLSVYQDREVQKALARNNEAKKAEIEDRCQTLVHLCNVCLDKRQTTLDDLRAFIETMFTDDVAKQGVVTLCTYHRAKGREWQRVFLREHKSRCPSPWAKQDWQKEQEANLAYVAITRAQHTLVFWR